MNFPTAFRFPPSCFLAVSLQEVTFRSIEQRATRSRLPSKVSPSSLSNFPFSPSLHIYILRPPGVTSESRCSARSAPLIGKQPQACSGGSKRDPMCRLRGSELCRAAGGRVLWKKRGGTAAFDWRRFRSCLSRANNFPGRVNDTEYKPEPPQRSFFFLLNLLDLISIHRFCSFKALRRRENSKRTFLQKLRMEL